METTEDLIIEIKIVRKFKKILILKLIITIF